MTAIPVNPLVPVTPLFVNGLDDGGNLLTDTVKFNDLDFTEIFGLSCTSTTENDVSFGVKTFTLDADIGNIQLDYTVQFRSIDPDVWMYGVVTGYSLLVSPAQITVNIVKISPLVGTYDNWTIQVVAGPAFGLPASAALGYSSDSKQFGSTHDIAIGKTVSLTTDAGKFMPPGSHILGYALSDSTQYYVGTAISYNISTGALSVFVTNVGPSATGTYAAWAVQTLDGPSSSVLLQGTSSASITIGSPGDFISFAATFINTQVAARSNIAFFYTPQDPTASFTIFGNLSVGNYGGNIIRSQGSGTFTSWVGQILVPELGNVASGIRANFRSLTYNNLTATGNPDNLLTVMNTAAEVGPASLTYVPTGALNSAPNLNLSWGAVADATLTIADNATVSGTNTGDQLTFKTISVSGQSDIVADTGADTLTVAAGTGITLTTNASTDTLTITGSAGASASTQAQMEAATDTTTFVSPGRQVYHPTQAKALYSATITPTATGVNVSAVDATNDIVTITAHGFTTGDQIETVASWPAGVTNGQVYYVNALSVNTLALYTTLANALADTSRVNITATTTGGTSRRFVFSNVVSYGLSAVSPIAGVTGSTTIGLVANISPSLSGTIAWSTLQPYNLFSSGPGALSSIWITGIPSSISTSVITFNSLKDITGGTANAPGTWANQSTSAYQVQFIMYGDLP